MQQTRVAQSTSIDTAPGKINWCQIWPANTHRDFHSLHCVYNGCRDRQLN